jgi:ribosomal protein S27AE
MPFSGDWTLRDCPRCGLRDVQMRHLAMNLSADRRGSTPRYWSVISCPRCGGAILIEHTPPNDPQPQLLKVAPEHGADVRGEHLPDAVRPYYEDAIGVLEAVGAQASHVDEKTARRALQFTTQVLRNLFEIPAERAARSEPESEDEPE